MRFWDSSALVPLLVSEPNSGAMQALLNDDPQGVVWWGTRVECWSALARRRREEGLSLSKEVAARNRLSEIATHWPEVLPGEEVRRTADLLLRRQPLRAADALQLAAALVFFGSDAGSIVTLDARLAGAAIAEGLEPVGLPEPA